MKAIIKIRIKIPDNVVLLSELVQFNQILFYVNIGKYSLNILGVMNYIEIGQVDSY